MFVIDTVGTSGRCNYYTRCSIMSLKDGILRFRQCEQRQIRNKPTVVGILSRIIGYRGCRVVRIGRWLSNYALHLPSLA